MSWLATEPFNTQTLEITIEGEPVPASRARVMNGYAYTPEKYREWKKEAVKQLVLTGIRFPKCDLSLTAYFYRSNKRRVDIDNLIKAVMDSLTQADIINDDSDIKALNACMGISKENPHVYFKLTRIN